MIVAFENQTAATNTSADFFPDESTKGQTRIWQVGMTGTGTVTLQGRVRNNLGFVTVATRTSSGAAPVDMYPEMRVTVSGMTGTYSVYIDTTVIFGT